MCEAKTLLDFFPEIRGRGLKLFVVHGGCDRSIEASGARGEERARRGGGAGAELKAEARSRGRGRRAASRR